MYTQKKNYILQLKVSRFHDHQAIHIYIYIYIIKIIPCVEGDISNCQPEGSSIARSRRLRAMVVVEG